MLLLLLIIVGSTQCAAVWRRPAYPYTAHIESDTSTVVQSQHNDSRDNQHMAPQSGPQLTEPPWQWPTTHVDNPNEPVHQPDTDTSVQTDAPMSQAELDAYWCGMVLMEKDVHDAWQRMTAAMNALSQFDTHNRPAGLHHPSSSSSSSSSSSNWQQHTSSSSSTHWAPSSNAWNASSWDSDWQTGTNSWDSDWQGNHWTDSDWHGNCTPCTPGPVIISWPSSWPTNAQKRARFSQQIAAGKRNPFLEDFRCACKQLRKVIRDQCGSGVVVSLTQKVDYFHAKVHAWYDNQLRELQEAKRRSDNANTGVDEDDI